MLIYLFVGFCIVAPPQNLTVSPPTNFPEGPFSANCEIMRLASFGMKVLFSPKIEMPRKKVPYPFNFPCIYIFRKVSVAFSFFCYRLKCGYEKFRQANYIL